LNGRRLILRIARGFLSLERRASGYILLRRWMGSGR